MDVPKFEGTPQWRLSFPLKFLPVGCLCWLFFVQIWATKRLSGLYDKELNKLAKRMPLNPGVLELSELLVHITLGLVCKALLVLVFVASASCVIVGLMLL